MLLTNQSEILLATWLVILLAKQSEILLETWLVIRLDYADVFLRFKKYRVMHIILSTNSHITQNPRLWEDLGRNNDKTRHLTTYMYEITKQRSLSDSN